MFFINTVGILEILVIFRHVYENVQRFFLKRVPKTNLREKKGLSLVKLKGENQSYQYTSICFGIAPIKMFNQVQKTSASGSRLVL